MVVCREDTNKTIIEIIGEFRIEIYDDFKEAYKSTKSNNIVLDFAETSGLSKAAYGIMIMMSDYLSQEQKNVQLVNVNEKMQQALDWTTLVNDFPINGKWRN